MSERSRPTSRLSALLLLLLAPGTLRAVQTRTWTGTTGELQLGRAEGIAVTRQGRLVLAPRLTRAGEGGPAGAAAHVWAVAADARGNTYLGTGPEGKILRIAPGGAESVLATLDVPMVTALLPLEDGSLLAGTAPDGKIYRVHADGGSEVWCATGERYVWSLLAGPAGSVYAGTGDRGIVLQIQSSGKAEPLFDSDESHITALAAVPGGGLVAGGAGRGLVYRLGRKGEAEVLYDTGMPEVSQVVVEPGGSLIVTALSSPDPEPRPPAVRIRVPQASSVGSTPEATLDLDERSTSTLEGVIEGLSPEGADSRSTRRSRGRVLRLSPSGSATELWRSSSEAPLALALDAARRPVFGTGEPGRIYRVAENGDVDLIATLREAQVTRLLSVGEHLLAGTSNPAALYRMEGNRASQGVFVSRPFDAQAQARWGTLRWREQGAPGGVQLQARSGNSADPDATWSDWGTPVSDPEGGPSGVPDARFLQWRAQLSGPAGASSQVGEVSVSYVTRNRPPTVDSLRLDGSEGATNGALKLRWSTSDPDADPVAVRIEYRDPRSAEWKTALPSEPASGPDDHAEAGDSFKDGEGTWETADVPEGSYELRAVASDQAANAPREGREASWEPPLQVVVDRTPPEIVSKPLPDGSLEVVVKDALSGVRRLELLEEGRTLFALFPIDGVADGKVETYRLAPDALSVRRKLRASDAAGNTTIREVSR